MKKMKNKYAYLLIVAIIGVVSIIGCTMPDGSATSPTGDKLVGELDANALGGPDACAGAGPGTVVSAIPIGTASTFAVLGATTVTNDGASLITGNLGVSPGTAITGFSSPPNVISGPGTVTAGTGIVTGTIYAAGPVAAQAHNDAVVAFAYLNAQVATPANSYAGVTTLDGLTFAPGVYSFAPAAILNAGAILTLDFGGNPNAVFIFKTGTTLTANALSKIIAINTGSSTATPNVFWAVGSSATINGAQFIGTVIANITITMTSGVTMEGAAIALTGAVTLINDAISAIPGAGSGSGGTVPPTCVDYISGGGWIDGNSDSMGHHKRYNRNRATFAISGGIKNGDFWGQLLYNDHGKDGIKVKSTAVTGYVVIDAVTREIDGTATINGQGSFTYKVIVADKGHRGYKDTFSIELSNGYSASDTLIAGNILLHTGSRNDHGKYRFSDNREYYNDKDETIGVTNFDL